MVKRVWKPIKDLGHLGPMALLTTFMPIIGSLLLITFLEPIGQWLRENWGSGAIVYLFGTLLLCGLALLPTNVIGIVGGWAFSFELGILILMLVVVGAATEVADRWRREADAHKVATSWFERCDDALAHAARRAGISIVRRS